MSSSALESQGMKLYNTASSPVVAIGEIYSMSGPSGSANEIEVSDFDSTGKEFRMGLPDEGNVTFDVFFDPNNTQHNTMRTLRAARTINGFRIDFTSSPVKTWAFNAFVVGLSIDNSVDDVVRASITLRISGIVTQA